ncbi:uncharacterized protein METZ01_LOCUS366984, partial [marine metagenome]
MMISPTRTASEKGNSMEAVASEFKYSTSAAEMVEASNSSVNIKSAACFIIHPSTKKSGHILLPANIDANCLPPDTVGGGQSLHSSPRRRMSGASPVVPLVT